MEESEECHPSHKFSPAFQRTPEPGFHRAFIVRSTAGGVPRDGREPGQSV